MSTYTSSPPTYHSATQSNTHPGSQNHQPRTDRGRPQVPPVFESEEREPLLPRRQQATSSTLSRNKKLSILLIVAAFSLYHLGWWARWDAGCQDRNLARWEQELKLKKVQERQREVQWDRQVDSNREQERLREAQRKARDLEWGRQMDDKREQERLQERSREAQRERADLERRRQMEEKLEREREQERLREAQRKRVDLEWERQMDDKREQERIREAQRKRVDLNWERQMDDKREQERIREAQWHMSQEQRERLGLYWDEPLTGSCISHGVRSYQARLLDAASYSYNPIVPCREMPLDIQGVSVKASYCESKGKETWGHWNVENDPLCTPVFQAWREDACVAPGSRRRLASARLDYITQGEDALQLCASTPIRFKDMYFDRPLSCAWSAWGAWGLWGHWEYDDNSC
ncbi:hypothetical protein FIBSPDRAFT_954815 [Athelia psychrophila]|uniref:Uncharacterized protein n=1 Tax=Athelia psychrophila TaxID=1759441 RepID=A0A166IV67_9AGAM|nr:hypothetical protein FIBSPDRAFT_954815 [Fibularhizoctonia sp. CBS 109695]